MFFLYLQTWDRWLGNIRHWCISRQLWWGHRIPAYLIKVNDAPEPDTSDPNNWVVARSEEEAMTKAVEKKGLPAESMSLQQDPDVLDTWFSSGLFPFSTMGWPNKESLDFKAFFPGSLLETGHDILFFWVARMVMMSQTLTDQLPFKEVYLHAMVRDKYGGKMSKSKGNVIDPLFVKEGATLETMLTTLKSGLLPEKELNRALESTKKEYPKGIPACGADALRFGLLAECKGKDVNLDINRVIGYRKFCNKLWNLHKLGLHFGLNSITPPTSMNDLLNNYKLSEKDLWILSRLHGVMVSVNNDFEKYSLSNACATLYQFLITEFAGIYAEISKPALRGNGTEDAKKAAIATFYTVLEISYRMLHPMMPYVTEELWQRLPRATAASAESETKGNAAAATPLLTIALASYPDPSKDTSLARLKNQTAEENMNVVIATIEAIRSLRGKFLTGKASSAKPDVVFTCGNEQVTAILTSNASDIASLVKLGTVTCVATGSELETGMAVQFVSDSVSAHMMLKGHIDFGAELPGLQKKLAKVVSGKVNLEKKRTPEYLERAKEDIQFREKEILEEYSMKIGLLEEQIAMFQSLA